MKVEIGNAHAIEGYREPDDEKLRFRELDGEHITTLYLPDDLDVGTAAGTVIVTMPRHMRQGAKPSWVQADNSAVEAYLVAHYQIENNTRPAEWGSDLQPLEAVQKPRKRAAKKAVAQPRTQEG